MIFKGEKIKKGDILKFQFSAKEFSSKNNTNPKLEFVLLACVEHKRNESELLKMNHWRYCYYTGVL